MPPVVAETLRLVGGRVRLLEALARMRMVQEAPPAREVPWHPLVPMISKLVELESWTAMAEVVPQPAQLRTTNSCVGL